jgi:hypothetical protein
MACLFFSLKSLPLLDQKRRGLKKLEIEMVSG